MVKTHTQNQPLENLITANSTFINSLPNDNFLDRTKLKAFAYNKSNLAKMMISVFDRTENIGGKRRECWLPAFSPFSSMFSKGFSFRVAYNPFPHNDTF